MNNEKPKYVLVTTLHRGVFAGELIEEDGTTVILRNARCAIRWVTTGGFLELADAGPNDKSTIGSVAPEIKLYDVTSISTCSDKAENAWKSHS